MTGVALHATPAGVPRPVLLYGGDLPIPRDAQTFCYPVEVWKVANGEVYAVVTDARNNLTHKCLQQPLAGKPRQADRRGDPHKASRGSECDLRILAGQVRISGAKGFVLRP